MWTFGPICSSPVSALRSIPASASDFISFINSQAASRILIEVSAVQRTTAPIGSSTPQPMASYPIAAQPNTAQVLGERTFFFGNGKWVGRPSDEYKANKRAIPRVSQSADIERSLPLSPETSRRGEVTLGNIELVNNEGGLDSFLSEYSIADRPVRIYYGPAKGDFKAFRMVTEVFGDGFQNTLDRVTLRLKSTAAYLDKPLYYSRYAGTGGFDGDANLLGTVKPSLFGQCFNVTPVLLNREHWIYQVHDASILAVDTVRERGADFIDDGDVDDYIALVNAVVPSGHYKTCLRLGIFKAGFSGEPAGPVTADVRGDVTAEGYTARTGPILLRIATQRAGLGSEFIQAETFAGGLPNGVVGYYSDGRELTCADVFNEMLAAVNGWYGSERTKILKAGYFVDPALRATGRTITDNQVLDIEELGIEQAPRWQQMVRYAKNWTPMADEDVTIDTDLITSTTRTALLSDGQSVTLTAASVRQLHRDAIIGDPIQTYFVGDDAEGDATEVCQRIMALYQESRRRFRIKLSRIGYLINLQDYVQIINRRLGLLSGKNVLVLGIRDDGRADTTEITVWG